MDNTNKLPECTSQLQLTFDHVNFTLHITGKFPNIDAAISMLQQALSEFELQKRQSRAMLMQKQAIEQAENDKIARSLRN